MKIVSVWMYAVLGLIMLSPTAKAQSGTGPTVFWSFGKYNLNLYVPVSQVNVTYLYDFVAHRSLVGGETPIASIWNLNLTGGGVTSQDGKGTPFVGFNLALPNPAVQFAALSEMHPGLFGGRDFNADAWIGGFKVSLNVF